VVVADGVDEGLIGRDYQQLLRRGSVMRRLAPTRHDAWRAAIRAKARADELRIRTWSGGGGPATVYAVLPDWSLTLEERARLHQRLAWRED
jgi:hypothetical protein